MANLFNNELGLILGILCAKHFKGRIYRYAPPGKPQGGGSGYKPQYRPSLNFLNDKGTGRGGYWKDYKGDFGKPGYGDEMFPAAEPSLAGQGGGLTYGGAGLEEGQFLYGGGSSSGQINISSGGGAGWYGGGSSMVSGGGGGGSSFVLSDLGISLLDKNTKILIEQHEDWEKYKCEWVDGPAAFGHVNSEVLDHPWLYDLNTYANDELEKYSGALGDRYEDWVDFRRNVNHNGCILVSKPNQIIRFDSENGWTGLDSIYYYTTHNAITWKAPESAHYHFICYGACGGDVSMATYETRGGCGGVASGRIYLEAETELFLVVGQKGQKYYRAYQGGGSGRGGATGGGGCTCIKYKTEIDYDTETTAYTRIITAGGGGGINDFLGNSNGLKEENIRVVEPSYTFPPNNGEEEELEEPTDENELIIPNMRFWVNDLSTVHVLVKCYNQQRIPDFARMNCSIYINDGMEGELHQSIKPGGGVYVKEFQFKLNTIYPPNTPTHEVLIQANIKTNFFSVLAQNGITVWVTTEDRLTDGSAIENKTKIQNNIDEIELSDTWDIELHRKGNLSIETEDEIELDDYIVVEKITKGGNDNYLVDEEDIEDKLVIETLHLNYINLDYEDEIEEEDIIDVELKYPVYIQILIDESTPYGTVDESDYVVYDKERIFKAYPNKDCLIEWYLDNEMISTDDYIVVKGLEDKTYIVKFIKTTVETIRFSDLGYINDNIFMAFDGLVNTREGHNEDYCIAWHDLVYNAYNPTGNYVEQTENDIRLDGITNSLNGHVSDTTEWSDIAGLDI